jgi:hypothetical protein
MPDPINRVRRFRERAAECRRLASLATSGEERSEYEALASQYEDIARAELSALNTRRAIRMI